MKGRVHRAAVAAALAFSLGLGALPHLTLAAASTVTKPYMVPLGDDSQQVMPYDLQYPLWHSQGGGPELASCRNDDPRPGWGWACFDVSAIKGGKVSFAVSDQLTQLVPETGGNYWICDDTTCNDWNGEFGNYCGFATDLPVPGWATELFVGVGLVNPTVAWEYGYAGWLPDLTSPPGLSCGSPSPGSNGTVTVTFNGPASASNSYPVRPTAIMASSTANSFRVGMHGVAPCYLRVF